MICLPSQMPPYTPPRREPEADEATPPADDAALDPELLAHKNIFEVQPRMSRQARRKALRAEKKAARRSAADRFVMGAPSLAEAASQMSALPSQTAFAERHTEAAQLDVEMEGPAKVEAIDLPAIAEVAALACDDLLVMERPAIEEREAEPVDVHPMLADPTADEPQEAALEALDEPETEAISLEEIARIISATGPLILPRIEADAGHEPADKAKAAEVPATIATPAFGPFWQAAPERDAANMLPEVTAAPALHLDAPEPQPEQVAPAIASVEQPRPTLHLGMPEPQPKPQIRIEDMTTPLPRNRALVTHKRHWLLRLVPWLRPRPKAPAPEPAMAQLQELRFELATALHRLDRIIDQAA